jgi:hypothetical protein
MWNPSTLHDAYFVIRTSIERNTEYIEYRRPSKKDLLKDHGKADRQSGAVSDRTGNIETCTTYYALFTCISHLNVTYQSVTEEQGS